LTSRALSVRGYAECTGRDTDGHVAHRSAKSRLYQSDVAGRRRDIAAFSGNIEVRLGDEADLDLFCATHEATARRERFTPLSRTYLHRQWACLSPQGWIRLFIAHQEGRPVAGIWHTSFGAGVTARVAGWTGEAAKLRPNIACYWGAIQWARDQGYRYYDFGGIDREFAEAVQADQRINSDRADSPDAFKYFFGGELTAADAPVHINPISCRDAFCVRATRRPVIIPTVRQPLPQRVDWITQYPIFEVS
jgi:hypothetical protein